MVALFGDDLMSIHTTEDIFNNIWLVRDESELMLYLIKKNRAELINIHLDEDLDERLVIMGFDSLCKVNWV